ncbi:hypothetical protein KIW84_020271 [Lathyrus oleraceus]|uniref:Uncharacterized protein n=1 Tax=Pisum sativum TaxID=3888 RepID=A0A9D5B3V6_PEA|nr:hypothetical protein KIW84_020271 [Pisum sativum]
MGFADRWIHWVMMCVTSVNYLGLVNMDKVGPIITGRGLQANLSEMKHLMDILHKYAQASAQEINMSKLEVFFTRNISGPTFDGLAHLIGVFHVLVLEILKVPLLEEVKEDCLVWKEGYNDNYSVKTGYKLLKKEQSTYLNLRVEGDLGSLWKIIAPKS